MQRRDPLKAVDAIQKAGMSEHFDAKTGAPQGDPAYIWTAAMALNWPDFY